MSLLLNGAKTMTIAGTTMQCLEIYTGEAYTFPINFTDQNGNAANALSPNAWNINASAKWYTVADVTYNATNTEIILGNLTLNNTQPNVANYTLVADWSNAANGQAYLYVGNNITSTAGGGGGGAPPGIPNLTIANNAANSCLVLVTVKISKQSSSNASLADINREPLGFIVRYQ